MVDPTFGLPRAYCSHDALDKVRMPLQGWQLRAALGASALTHGAGVHDRLTAPLAV
jgi:hypothetical protein